MIIGPKGVGKTSLVRSLRLIYNSKSSGNGNAAQVRPIHQSPLTDITQIKFQDTTITLIDTLREIKTPEDLALYQGYTKIADMIICMFDISNMDEDYHCMQTLFDYFYKKDIYSCLIGNKADLMNSFGRKRFLYNGHFVITAIDPLSVELVIEYLTKHQSVFLSRKEQKQRIKAREKYYDDDFEEPRKYFFCCPFF